MVWIAFHLDRHYYLWHNYLKMLLTWIWTLLFEKLTRLMDYLFSQSMITPSLGCVDPHWSSSGQQSWIAFGRGQSDGITQASLPRATTCCIGYGQNKRDSSMYDQTKKKVDQTRFQFRYLSTKKTGWLWYAVWQPPSKRCLWLLSAWTSVGIDTT